MSFLGRIGSVMKSLGLKDGIESIYTLVTSRGHFLLDSAIFTLILSNAIEDFITASFQIDDQNRINETNKTEIEAENRMNETENRQRKMNEQMKRIPGKRKISQLSNKEWSTKDTGSKELRNERIQDVIKKIKFYNLWVKRLFAKIFKNVKATD